ncbi:unnamed protein product [Diatraea saccharalis]|uniref:Hemolin n=1 Tax=Diatraea saccharalis TaxID=40085 RepID=A0A9N9QXP2_9NEOP|nr:unnamed protein product [Diatraea saccharalis]
MDNGMLLVPLIIHEVKVEDTGSWTCKAGEYNETIDIVVGIKVKFHTRQTTMEGDEGKNAKLTCEAKGHPLPVIQWYKDGKLITDKTDPNKYAMRKKGDNYILEVKSLTYQDIGEYLCKVTQKALSYYTDKTILLSVKPKISRAVLSRIQHLLIVGTGDTKPLILQFLRKKREEDFGQYTCKVSNSKGNKTVIFDVSLGERPTPPDDVTLIAANATHLTFNVSCEACPIRRSDNISPDPKNLTVIDTVFEVGELSNMTTFHGRVRTRNLAGVSDWFDIHPDPSTTSYANSIDISLAILIIAFITTRY